MPARRKPTRPKRRKRFNFGKLLGRLILIASLLAVGWWGLGFVRDLVIGGVARTVVASAGTVEQIISADAWLMPTVSETQVAPLDGMVYLKAPDGDRTRVGNRVAEIIDPDKQRELVDRQSQLERQLSDLRQRNTAERESATKRLTEIETLLPAKLADLQAVTKQGDQAAIQRLQGEIRDLGTEKQTLEGRIAALDASETELAAQHQQATDAVSQTAYQMLALFPGVISYRFDGLDDVLTPEKAIPLGSRGLWSLKERDETVHDREILQAGRPVFKVIDPAATYIVLAVKADEYVDLGQGPVSLRFSQFKRASVRAELVNAGAPERNGYLVAVYRTSEFLPEFVTARRVSVEIVKSAGNGVVVPDSALVRRGGQTGVWLVKLGTARFTPVTVLASNGAFAAVDGISNGAEVIKTGWLVFREGQRIK
ncbi:MAG: HlyD family efflux transporter periplasmic adaptor subunit [Chloroflexota bacterium]